MFLLNQKMAGSSPNEFQRCSKKMSKRRSFRWKQTCGYRRYHQYTPESEGSVHKSCRGLSIDSTMLNLHYIWLHKINTLRVRRLLWNLKIGDSLLAERMLDNVDSDHWNQILQPNWWVVVTHSTRSTIPWTQWLADLTVVLNHGPPVPAVTVSPWWTVSKPVDAASSEERSERRTGPG